jgi:glycine hydroxymethyltransferase
VELIAVDLAKRLFRAEFADVRPIAGVTANLSVYTAFTEPGDVMLSLAIPNGGHITYGPKRVGGTAGRVRGLDVEYLPFDEESMNVDVDAARRKIEKLTAEGRKPRIVVFGGSLFLFPHPVRELSDYLRSMDIKVAYDGAHVLGLIAGGEFQDPLREGADVMMGSTHKTLPGPQGGVVLSWERYADQIKQAVFPSNVSNHHLHHVAGKAVAFAEMLAFGREYASQVVRNARRLAEELASRGFKVLGEAKGYTRSHQVVLDVTHNGGGMSVEKRLEDSNIIVNRNLLPYDLREGRSYKDPGGIRIGVQEVTRLGMKEGEMADVAEFIARVIIRNEPPERVAADVAEFRRGFNRVNYAFESPLEAYEYVKLVR